MNWYVYIAKARTGAFYTGISNNPQKRLEKHNSGRGSRMAKQQGPFSLVYISDAFPNKSKARLREVQIKSWGRDKKLKLIEGIWK